MTRHLIQDGDVWAMRSLRSRRSGLLRTQPLRVFALREPDAIAIGVQGNVPLGSPTGEAGAPNLSTLEFLGMCAVAAFLGFALAVQL
jgi:hypothetical protein